MEYFNLLKNINGIELNNQQIKAASFDKGNALVLSTAGSGKTTVVIARVGRLLYENKLNNKILTITFSKAAAKDMSERFISFFGVSHKTEAVFSTIHAFSYKIVKDYFRRKSMDFNLLTNNYHVLSELLKSYYQNKYYNYISEEEVENLSSSISFMNNMMINPSEYKNFGIEIKGFDQICEAYKLYKSKNKLIDFDDMLFYAHKILTSSGNEKEKIKNMYEYVQVDEMQDTSKIQHEIIKCITGNNLFMVGDDDQAIYSFRGSYPDFMLNFKDYYHNGTIFHLDTNYRSDKNIVEGAKKFIEKNKIRYKKQISTNNKKEHEINIIKTGSRKEQAKYITEELEKIRGESVGILFRYNISAMILSNSFFENNIDFYIKEDRNKFFNSPILTDIIAFLSLALNPMDRNAFFRIYYKSYTYFTKSMCKIVMDSKRDDLTVFDILDNYKYFDYYVYDKIRRFKTDINYINKLKPENAVKFIKTEMEYINYLERMQDEGRSNLSASLHILEILEEIGSYCGNIKEFTEKIQNLRTVIKDASANTTANVVLTTIHSAKGLEYEHVYMIDNLEGEFPSESKNISNEEYEKNLEEERRIFYVGMTRAKKTLNIIVPGKPSMFIKELVQTNSK